MYMGGLFEMVSNFGVDCLMTVGIIQLCPNNGNAQWCPTVGGKNQYGYAAHFDILSGGLINGSWGE